jgi:hypothetical protein
VGFRQNIANMSPAPEQDPQEQWRKIVAEDDRTVSSYWRALRRRFMKMPRWTRIGAITLLLVFALAAVYAFSPAESARLQIICQHNFRSAQLSVLVDGEQVYGGGLTTKKRMGILPKGGSGVETFSKVINVPTGRHVVQVRINAPEEGFDQSRSAAADFAAEQESIISINATRRNTLAVSLEGASVVSASTASESHAIPKSGITILFSILGTMLSASISFLVQEFWRSHKNRASSN